MNDITTEVKTQAITDLSAPLTAALDSIIATPTTTNAVVQGATILPALAAVLPTLESQGIVDLATALKSALASAVANASAAPVVESSASGASSASGSAA